MNLDADEEYDYMFKVLLIGDSTVGKTCLAHRFIHHSFNAHTVSTMGVDFASTTVEIDDKRIRAQVWDTAGQERFKAMTPVYYRGADGAMVVFDVTNRDTFVHIERWLDELKQHANPSVKIVVIGNKVDLSHLREVTTEDGEKYCETQKFAYLETSALSNTNVDTAFISLCSAIYNDQQQKNLKPHAGGVGVPESQPIDQSRITPADFRPSLPSTAAKPKSSCC